jgi:hypothetical protein
VEGPLAQQRELERVMLDERGAGTVPGTHDILEGMTAEADLE